MIVKQTPSISIPIGTQQTFEKSLKLRHEVIVNNHSKFSGGVDGSFNNILIKVQAGIKAEIEKTFKENYLSEEEQKSQITLKGTGKKYKILWIKYYRTGEALIRINGKEKNVPFEFEDTFGLSAVEVR